MTGGTVPLNDVALADRRLRVLMPVLHPSTFIMQDVELLRERYEVKVVNVTSLGGITGAIGDLRRADCVLCWFGSVRFLPLAAAARLTGTPLAIISGGYDVACEPAIGYGNMRAGLTRVLGRLLFRLANRVVPYSRAGQAETTRNAGVSPTRQRLVMLGLDGERTGAAISWQDKAPMVLTVGFVDGSTIHRKGILQVIRVAALLPEISFVVAGRIAPEVRALLDREAGANVRFTGHVSEAELAELYARARVYVQPSLHEAFGVSVAEAMLYNCIPVVSRIGSLPEVVGETGYYVAPGDLPGLAAALSQALAGPPQGVITPRERIIREFPLAARRAGLFALLDSLGQGAES